MHKCSFAWMCMIEVQFQQQLFSIGDKLDFSTVTVSCPHLIHLPCSSQIYFSLCKVQPSLCKQSWRWIGWWSLKTKSLLFTPFADLMWLTFFFFSFLMVLHGMMDENTRILSLFLIFSNCGLICLQLCLFVRTYIFICTRRQGWFQDLKALEPVLWYPWTTLLANSAWFYMSGEHKVVPAIWRCVIPTTMVLLLIIL